ncbi:Proteinase inhibitor, propeptide [Beauveria brongniartii RCEF 3172]|uniref:Proteinase inhibitor, propeptide n=1 Tax=Beauveria brongniartii RCEF 3172 TaxID=1081107 RepID=A0A162J5U5_9HYPO|nr:Proteinase inhibitor, propeptide [Beauveria brongniartii RCEF 3172]
MPTYIVTLKDDASPEQVKEAKAKCVEQGGKIIHEYDIIKGFSVSYPEDAITTLESNPYVKAVEPDGVATIQ